MAIGVLPFIGLFLCIWALAPSLGRGSWRHGALRAAVLWGLYAILSLELLSLFSAVTRPVLVGLWLLPIAILLGYKTFEIKRIGIPTWSFHWLPDNILGKILAVSLLAVIVITALVAWLTPPNTWDSLNYHMPRVAQWAQLEAVRHFPTGIEIQNSMPPAAEMLILHSYVLAQGDRWANFVAWIAVWVSVLGVSLITKQLGTNRRGQWLAVAFAASLPTAIIQASSTMTDAVMGLWVIVAVSEAVHLMKEENLSLIAALTMSAAAGLAALTKPTAFAYLLPVAIYIGFVIIRHSGWNRALLMALIAIVLVTGINAGHWNRNNSLYGNPISHPGRVAVHSSPWLGGRAFISNLVRNVAMHSGTPSAHLNKGITYLVQELHQFLDLEVNDARTTVTGIFKIRWGETNEDKATNPLHFYVFSISLLLGWILHKRLGLRLILYLSLPLTIVLLFSLLFQWQLYAGRFHTSLFMLLAPAMGKIWGRRISFHWVFVASIALIVLSWPWYFQIKSRPVIPDPAESYVGSILTTPRRSLYLANAGYMEDSLERFSEISEESICQRYGIIIRGSAPEYLWWVWLQENRPNLDIGWIVEGTPSATLTEAKPNTCGVVCQDCGNQSSFGDKPLVEIRANYSLYIMSE